MVLKFENIKGDQQYVDNDKNFQKLGFLDFLLFYVKRGWYASFGKPLGTRVNKILALQPANAIKTKFLATTF